MPRKPNYGFEKRKKELDRQAKKEEKLRRKREQATERAEERATERAALTDEGAAAPSPE